MKNYSIPQDLLEKILTYMGQKPWTEVQALMQEIMEKTKPVQDKENG